MAPYCPPDNIWFPYVPYEAPGDVGPASLLQPHSALQSLSAGHAPSPTSLPISLSFSLECVPYPPLLTELLGSTYTALLPARLPENPWAGFHAPRLFPEHSASPFLVCIVIFCSSVFSSPQTVQSLEARPMIP